MKKQNRYLCIYSFSITFLLMLILFWHYGYAPFGGNSMASHDASVQYLDFYSSSEVFWDFLIEMRRRNNK